MRPIRAWAFAAVLMTGCASTDPEISEARVREFEQRARALAKTEGCEQANQCATAPVGAKACGGPRTYVVYCKATTDEAALLRALDELKRAEEAYNQAAGIASDCMFVTPPAVRLDDGVCLAATP